MVVKMSHTICSQVVPYCMFVITTTCSDTCDVMLAVEDMVVWLLASHNYTCKRSGGGDIDLTGESTMCDEREADTRIRPGSPPQPPQRDKSWRAADFSRR